MPCLARPAHRRAARSRLWLSRARRGPAGGAGVARAARPPAIGRAMSAQPASSDARHRHSTPAEATGQDLPVLVSFPKSGSNWVRYCIEHFSGRPTPGSKRQLLVSEGELVIDRTHFLDKQDRDAYLGHTVNPRRRPRPSAQKSRLLGMLERIKGAMRRSARMRNRRLILLLR